MFVGVSLATEFSLHEMDLRQAPVGLPGSLKHLLFDAEGVTPPGQLLFAVLQSILQPPDDGHTLVDEARVLA